MSNVNVFGTASSDLGNVLLSDTHTIYNVASPGTADTEFSQAITSNTQQLMIRVRGNARLQFSFVSGESGTKFITIRPGGVYWASNLSLSGATLYMQCNKASQTVEISEWST